MARAYQFHRETKASAKASMEAVFAFMDDPARLGAHMGRHTAMMGGAVMRTEMDAGHGQAVGSVIRMAGSLLGLALSLEEVVDERAPVHRKAWETRGQPRLLVIDQYRMGFDLAPDACCTTLRVWIDYNLPRSGVQRWLGQVLGHYYAQWCTQQMAQETARSFSDPPL